MPKTHVVRKCEHISAIAKQHGFASFRTIWDHPDNAEIKQKRKDPHILQRGDVVIIPDRDERLENKATENRHRFVLRTEPLVLRVKVLDVNTEAVPGPCFLEASGTANLMLEKEETFESADPIRPDLKEALMNFPQDEDKHRVELKIGCLEPIDTAAGQRDRLNNLGYFAGFAELSDQEIAQSKRFIWAVEEFQCDHGIKPQKPVCDQQTQAALEEAHGC